jgi:type IV conjugative transfer system coupling protein TraD
MAAVKTITQGGQVHIHQLRMLKQVLIAGFVVTFISALGCFVWKANNLPKNDWRMFYEFSWARFMLATNPASSHPRLTQMYTPPNKIGSSPTRGQAYKRRCISVLNDPLLKKTAQRMELILEHIFYQSLKFAGLMFLAVMGLWFFMGRSHKKPEHQRGTTFVPWKTLSRMLKTTNQASDLALGELPLLKDKETSHLLLTGTTGSGKTNGFHTLLPQIRARGNRAIIVDVTGTYVSPYYDPETDLILNPLDTRSEAWHPWADCILDSHYDVLAESLIQPKEKSKDPFWDEAARGVLKTALRKFAFQQKTNIEELTTFLLSSSGRDFEDFFKNTEAATFTCQSNEKTTQSIRSVLSSQIEGLRQLEATEKSFSIREWVEDENQQGFLFITARPDQRKALTPLMSTWVELAINALMVLPEDYNRRLWFIIDELAALQKLPCLQNGLAEARKYGGCFLVGFQSKPQLEEIYGRNAAEAMLDLFNTKLFFRCTEPSTQAWISKVLGDKEEIEPQENISYGAHSTRDGVSLSRHTRQKPIVMPAELSQLKDLECYIKYPGDYPSTKIQMTYQSVVSSVEPFLLKPEKKREYLSSSSQIEATQETGEDQTNQSPQEVEEVPDNKEALV